MNWAQIIGDLLAAGYSQTELAERCNCAQSTISDLANGKNTDPRFSIADALRSLRGDLSQPARKPQQAKAA